MVMILSLVTFGAVCSYAVANQCLATSQATARIAQTFGAADQNSLNGAEAVLQTMDIPISRNVQPEHASKEKKSDCPRLESMLLHLSQAEDPLQLAEQAGLVVRGGKIQVILVLVDPNETGFLKGFDVDVCQKQGSRIQAFVPVEQLCDLARADQVLAVRAPAKAIPQQVR